MEEILPVVSSPRIVHRRWLRARRLGRVMVRMCIRTCWLIVLRSGVVRWIFRVMSDDNVTLYSLIKRGGLKLLHSKNYVVYCPSGDK